MIEIKKYSQIPCSHTTIIDNFNKFTNCCIVCESIDFYRVYRVFKRSRIDNSLHEKYFLDSSFAFDYWSNLMSEKQELF